MNPDGTIAPDCLKLTSYYGERSRVGGRFYAEAQLDVFGRHRVATSVLLRGAAGFGLKHHLRTDRLLTLSDDLPVVSVAVDTRPIIEAVLDELRRDPVPGLVTLERARLLSDGSGPLEAPGRPAEAAKLTLYLGRQQRLGRTPAFAAVCELLHRRGIDGATVFLGVDGTSRGERTRARFFARNADVPVMVVAVGSGEQIAVVLPELGELLPRSPATLERVRVCKAGGRLLQRPHPLSARDETGLELWQKLMIYTSERDLHGGEPVHRALVRRLRSSDARGATVLRGIWGFRGDRPPHGDRLLQLGRSVPVCTVLVDTPERIAASFDVVDELTAEHGVVTSEMVPALTATAPGTVIGGFGLADHPY